MRPERITTESPLAESSPADQRTEGSHKRMVGLRAMHFYALESKFCAECGIAATGETQHALAAAMHHGQAIAFEYAMKQSNHQLCSAPDASA